MWEWPSLIGGTTVSGAAVAADGLVLERLVATTGNTDFAFGATSAFEGAVDELVVFRETETCVDAGSWDYYFEPQNSENIAGPTTGPFVVVIF